MDFFKKQRGNIIFGALAGLVNGILGAGGGIIATYYLSKALSDEEKGENGVFANAVATMLPISIFSLGAYLIGGYIKVDSSLISLLPSGAIGGIIGAFLLTKLQFKIVKLIFSVLVIISGAMMILR